MSVEVLYILYSVCLWAGLAFAIVGVARFAVERTDSWKSPIFVGAPLLIAAALLHPFAGVKGAFMLPLVWWVAPIAGWIMALGGLMVLLKALQWILAVEPDAKAKKMRELAFWFVAGGIGAWLWSREAFESRWLRGGVNLTLSSTILLVVLALVSAIVMTHVARSAKSTDRLRTVATHFMLVAGSLVFGLPFFWLLITSFKEDRDMASVDGLVWVPRVTEMAPYFDPDDQVVEDRFEGQTVQGSIIKKNPDGSALIDVIRPGAMRGMTFTAKPPLKLVPKDMQVVSFKSNGEELVGKTIKDFGDGAKEVEVLRPEARKGAKFKLAANEYELVRHVGLRTQNYVDALEFLPPETMKGLVYLKNSLMLALLTVIGTLLSSSLVAYAFARLRFPSKNLLFGILLATMALPAAVTMLPTFLIFRSLGWVDTLLPLWVPSFLGSAFNIFLLRQFFSTIPLELEDAAKIDGCGYLGTYWRVMAPQIQPALAFVAVTTAMQAWNNFMGPLVYVNSPEKMPIAYAVQLFQGDRVGEPGLLMAFATMGMAPILLLFFFTQKYFVENVALSGLGGR